MYIDKYQINREKMDVFKNEVKEEKTNKEIIVENILKKHRFDFVFKKGFLKQAKDFCVVDFYLSKPYRAVIQIFEDKKIKLDDSMLYARKFHLLMLDDSDFINQITLEDKLRVFLSNCKYRNKTPKKKRQTIVR